MSDAIVAVAVVFAIAWVVVTALRQGFRIDVEFKDEKKNRHE